LQFSAACRDAGHAGWAFQLPEDVVIVGMADV
jgi:hypothetical protein